MEHKNVDGQKCASTELQHTVCVCGFLVGIKGRTAMKPIWKFDAKKCFNQVEWRLIKTKIGRKKG